MVFMPKGTKVFEDLDVILSEGESHTVEFKKSELMGKRLLSDMTRGPMSDNEKKQANKGGQNKRKTSEKQANSGQSKRKTSEKQTKNKRIILSYLDEHGRATVAVCAEVLKLSEPRVRAILLEMVKKNMIDKVGKTKSSYYVLKQ